MAYIRTVKVKKTGSEQSRLDLDPVKWKKYKTHIYIWKSKYF